MKKQIIASCLKIANELDENGYFDEADKVTGVANELAKNDSLSNSSHYASLDFKTALWEFLDYPSKLDNITSAIENFAQNNDPSLVESIKNSIINFFKDNYFTAKEFVTSNEELDSLRHDCIDKAVDIAKNMISKPNRQKSEYF